MNYTVPRILAVILSGCGLVWALFLAVIIFSGGAGMLLMFGPGYLIWGGWILRSFLQLDISIRVLIWIASIIYHTALFCSFRGDSSSGTPDFAGFVYRSWFVLAGLVSFLALVFERKEPNQSLQPTPTSRGG